MDEITFDELEAAKALPAVVAREGFKLDETRLKEIEKSLEFPIQKQQELAAMIKMFLDKSMKEELESKGYLSDYTRRWVKVYNELLDSIQKGLYGDKSVSLHLHKVTHAHIASKIKKYSSVEAETVDSSFD